MHTSKYGSKTQMRNLHQWTHKSVPFSRFKTLQFNPRERQVISLFLARLVFSILFHLFSGGAILCYTIPLPKTTHQTCPNAPWFRFSRLRWSAFRTPTWRRGPMSWSLSQALRAPPSGWLGWWSTLRLSAESGLGMAWLGMAGGRPRKSPVFMGFLMAFLANLTKKKPRQPRQKRSWNEKGISKERWDGMGFVLDPGFFFELPIPLPISTGAKKLRTSPICAKVAIHAQHLKMDREEMKCSSLFLCFHENNLESLYQWVFLGSSLKIEFPKMSCM